MGRSPQSKYPPPPQGTKSLTAYFSTSSSSPKKRQATINIDDENDENGTARKKLKLLRGVGTALSPLQIFDNAMDSVTALVRINSADEKPSKLTVRAGDKGIFIMRQGGIIGRSLNADASNAPISLRHKKMDIGIYGADSGVSRKQLEIKRVVPLKIKQLANVTNQVFVLRYNPLIKTTEQRGTIIGKGQEFDLKYGDVITMDKGRGSPKHVFRVVECLVPKQGNKKKRPLGQVKSSPASPAKTIDLVHSASQSSGASFSSSSVVVKKRVSSSGRLSLDTLKTAALELNISSQDTKQGSEASQGSRSVKDESKTKAQKHVQVITKLKSDNTNSPTRKKEANAASRKSPYREPKAAAGSEKKPRALRSVAKVVQFDQEPGKTKQKPAKASTTVLAANSAKAKAKSLEKALVLVMADAKARAQVRADTKTRAQAKFRAQVETEEAEAAWITAQAKARAQVEVPPIVEPPQVGDHVRVVFEMQDTFLRERASWWFGTVQKVMKEKQKGENGDPTYSLSVVFRDKSNSDHPFPDEDVQKLEIDGETRFVHALVPTKFGVRRELAFDHNPESVAVGDLVDALYRDGGDDGKWYRGRIAAVDTKKKTCIIAYEDGDAEADVPMGQGKIVLVGEGDDDKSWLVSMKVYDDFISRTKNKTSQKKMVPTKPIGAVTTVEEVNGRVFVVISFVSRKKEHMPYDEFVSYVFESLLSRYKSMKKWPTAGARASKPSRTVRKAFAKVKEEEPVSSKGREATEEKPTRARKKTNTKIKEEFLEEDWDISKSIENPAKKEEPTGMRELPQTLSSSFFRALNIADPLVGADLLVQAAVLHKQGMNASLGRNIRDLLCDGPTSEGTKFPDPHRVEVTLRYLDTLVACEDGDDNLSRSCIPDDWPALHEMLENIIAPRYLYDGDGISEDAAAWDRIVDSLHLSKSGARFLTLLFKAELGEQIRMKTPDKQRCRAGPIATAIWGNTNGARHCVKAIIKAFVGSWIRYGHHVLCDFASLKSKANAPSSIAIVRCRDEGNEMLKELGSVVSYTLWLYSVCEGVPMSSRDLAYLVKEVYESESSSPAFDPAVFMSTKKVPAAYLKKLKLHLVLGLDENIVGGLQQNLAKQLGVEKEFKCVIE
jgi:hypothetical protein